MPRLKTDKLPVSVYARHEDSCHANESASVHDSLRCASGFKANDYVLVARFSYLQEGIDYCQTGARRGVSMRLVSRITSIPHISNYVPRGASLPEEYRSEGAYTVGENGELGRIAALGSAQNPL
jgi:hypothetical protein